MNVIQFMRQISSRFTTNVSATSSDQASQMARFRQYQKEAQRDVLDEPLQELPMVVFDLETSGFQPDYGDSILSIGAVKIKGSTILHEHFYKTIKPKKAPSEEILHLTGLTAYELEQSEALKDVLLAFYQFVGSATLIAHHAAHERRFMRHATWQELGRTFTHRLIDTSFLTQITAAHQSFDKLEDWCHAYNIAVGNRHHALADAHMAAQLWVKHSVVADHAGYTTLSHLYKALAAKK
ncbi:exonuclease domain-containing protein [Shouchella sp. 1P09AA]|uniref:exonuclease domain-containing protein n=1 Tax=unclassified Shouchella TaxID=2893065 RepID=UPI0039A2E0B4